MLARGGPKWPSPQVHPPEANWCRCSNCPDDEECDVRDVVTPFPPGCPRGYASAKAREARRAAVSMAIDGVSGGDNHKHGGDGLESVTRLPPHWTRACNNEGIPEGAHVETEEPWAVVQRLQAALIRQGELAEQLDLAAGPRDPANLQVLAEILSVQNETRSIRRELVELGVLERDDL